MFLLVSQTLLRVLLMWTGAMVVPGNNMVCNNNHWWLELCEVFSLMPNKTCMPIASNAYKMSFKSSLTWLLFISATMLIEHAGWSIWLSDCLISSTLVTHFRMGHGEKRCTYPHVWQFSVLEETLLFTYVNLSKWDHDAKNWVPFWCFL